MTIERSELSPQELNQRLGIIQKKLPIEAMAASVLGVAALPLIYIGMVEYYGNDPTVFAAVVGFKLGCVASVVANTFGAARLVEQTINDVKERGNILNLAQEQGLRIRGTIFKRINGSYI